MEIAVFHEEDKHIYSIYYIKDKSCLALSHHMFCAANFVEICGNTEYNCNLCSYICIPLYSPTSATILKA